MRVTAKTDYALRAMVELAATSSDSPLKAEAIAESQHIPLRFLLNILSDLRIAKLVDSRRGADGGYRIAQPAGSISVADVIRAVEGPLADVHGTPPEALDYPAPATAMRDVWMASRAALRRVLETVTLADIATSNLPGHVIAELTDPDTFQRR